MRKTEATVHARIQSNRDKVPVELWSRAPSHDGIEIPRIARNWVRLSHKDKTDQELLDAQRELEERGFRYETTVDLSDWDGKEGTVPAEKAVRHPSRGTVADSQDAREFYQEADK